MTESRQLRQQNGAEMESGTRVVPNQKSVALLLAVHVAGPDVAVVLVERPNVAMVSSTTFAHPWTKLYA
jgi:hypothetical protein